MSVYERSQDGVEIYIYELELMKNKFAIKDFQENPKDVFLNIGEGRVYEHVKSFNTEDEGKKQFFDDKGYLINNPNYRFKEF